MARLQNRTRLAVNARSVEEESRAGRAGNFEHVLFGKGLDFGVAPVPGLVFPVGPAQVAECAGLNVGEVKTELHLAGNSRDRRFVVPGVAVPPVEHPSGGQGSPALGFHKLKTVAQVRTQGLLDDLVNSNGDEALVERENILDHQAESLGPFIPIEIIPAQPLQAQFEGTLHAREHFALREPGEHDDPGLFQLPEDIHNVDDRRVACQVRFSSSRSRSAP